MSNLTNIATGVLNSVTVSDLETVAVVTIAAVAYYLVGKWAMGGNDSKQEGSSKVKGVNRPSSSMLNTSNSQTTDSIHTLLGYTLKGNLEYSLASIPCVYTTEVYPVTLVCNVDYTLKPKVLKPMGITTRVCSETNMMLLARVIRTKAFQESQLAMEQTVFFGHTNSTATLMQGIDSLQPQSHKDNNS